MSPISTRVVDEGKQEDKESGKQAKFYFRGLIPHFSSVLRAQHMLCPSSKADRPAKI